MRLPTALAAALAVLVACASAAAGTSVPTSLRIAYKRTATADLVVRVVTCSRVPGAEPTRACARLKELVRPFAPVPPGSVCTEIYGGPQTARVTGTFEGRRIWVVFRRTNGCEIDRWNRHAFLFPGGR